MGPGAEVNLVVVCWHVMVQHAITYKYRPADCGSQDGNNRIRGRRYSCLDLYFYSQRQRHFRS